MPHRPALLSGLPLLALLLLLGSCPAGAQATRSRTRALPDGLEVAQQYTVRVTALRDDILRITATQNPPGEPREEGSWAVLPEARAASIKVTGVSSDGFSTAALKVHLGPDLAVTVTGLHGEPVFQQAGPVRWEGDAFRLSLRNHDDDHYFGLGDKPGPLDRAGRTFTMWNTDAYGWQESTDPLYKDIPFFLNLRAGRAAGVFLDNTYRTTFDFGHEDRERVILGAPDGPLTLYVLAGPEPKHVVESYAWLTGKTPLPPIWALGYHQSRFTYEPEARLLGIARRLRAERIPSDAVYLDIDYQDRFRPFTVDMVKFPHFAATVAELARQHFRLVVITDLSIAKAPGEGYAPYDSGVAEDRFVKMPDGSVYTGTVWPGASVFPDFTVAATRAWWGALYSDFAKMGVAGFWNDMNEPAAFNIASKTLPETSRHRIDEPGFARRTATHREIHNVYGLLNTRGTYEGLLELRPKERPFVLTRASYAGGQRFAATWTGDNSATWNHLRMTTPQLVNLGLSGFALAGADVGGFAGSPPPDLLTKWYELAAFQPIDRSHAAKGTRDHEPWVDGPVHLAIRRRFLEQRYRLLPYLYTVTEEMARTGLPIVRPLFLEFPAAATDDGTPLDIAASGEFLVGPSLLVAPSPSPEEVMPYEVRLPPGRWYDFWTGEPLLASDEGVVRAPRHGAAAADPEPLRIEPTLSELPVYARAGAILPLQPLVQSTGERPRGPLTLRVYTPGKASGDSPATPCEGALYLDDGTSFAYREAKLLRLRFTCSEAAGGSLVVRAESTAQGFVPWWKTVRLEVYGWTPKQRTASAGERRAVLRPSGRAWITEVATTDEAFTVTLR